MIKQIQEAKLEEQNDLRRKIRNQLLQIVDRINIFHPLEGSKEAIITIHFKSGKAKFIGKINGQLLITDLTEKGRITINGLPLNKVGIFKGQKIPKDMIEMIEGIVKIQIFGREP